MLTKGTMVGLWRVPALISCNCLYRYSGFIPASRGQDSPPGIFMPLPSAWWQATHKPADSAPAAASPSKACAVDMASPSARANLLKLRTLFIPYLPYRPHRVAFQLHHAGHWG